MGNEKMTDKKKVEYEDLTPKGKKLNDILNSLSGRFWEEAKAEIKSAIDDVQITKKEIEDVASSISEGNFFIYDTLCKDVIYTDFAEDEPYDLEAQPDDWIVGTEKPNPIEQMTDNKIEILIKQILKWDTNASDKFRAEIDDFIIENKITHQQAEELVKRLNDSFGLTGFAKMITEEIEGNLKLDDDYEHWHKK